MMMTPKRNRHARKPQVSQISENFNPNLLNPTPSRRPIKSPSPHSAKKLKKLTPKTPIQIKTPPPTSNKKSSEKKSKEDQEPNRDSAVVDSVPCEADESARDSGFCDLEGSSKVRKMKSLMLEEAMSSIPEPGAGRVMHLVKAFERLLSISKEQGGQSVDRKKGRAVNWALPGLQQPPKAEETEISSLSLFSSLDFESESSEHTFFDSNGDRLSWGSSSSDCDKRSPSRSTCTSERSWSKRLKETSQQPFKLRTEQRGRSKEENLLKKVREMFLEEEKQRIPVARGLPWTTEYPECLLKPFVKECTEPVDPVLHSDARAIERAEFDHRVAERMSFLEQIKLERERLLKLEEEEEIRKLRKELVQKAQPMPYFDWPFVPKKSPKPQTIPKETSLHIRQ